MKRRDLERKLRIAGYYLKREGSSHSLWINSKNGVTEAVPRHTEIKISTKAENGFVEIKISDTGTGISEENISKIFDPFFITKEVGKGTGMGMNIAYNIIKKHNGTIDIQSTVGKGTTFIIKLLVT